MIWIDAANVPYVNFISAFGLFIDLHSAEKKVDWDQVKTIKY